MRSLFHSSQHLWHKPDSCNLALFIMPCKIGGSFDITLAEITTIQPHRVTGYYTVVAFDFIAVGLSPPFCLAECHSAVVGGREGGHRRVKKALLGGALL